MTYQLLGYVCCTVYVAQCMGMCVAQWEGKVEKGQEDFEKLSKVIRREVSRFEAHRVDDFKNSVVKYLQTLMENQQKVGAGRLFFHCTRQAVFSVYSLCVCMF